MLPPPPVPEGILPGTMPIDELDEEELMVIEDADPLSWDPVDV